jgi:hypothetical protein
VADDRVIGHVGRRTAAGAFVGAAVGVVVGVAVHAIVGDVDAVTGYEVVGALGGMIVGTALGGFYGGAAALPRDPPAGPSRDGG